MLVSVFVFKYCIGAHQNTLENIPVVWATSVSSPLSFSCPFYISYYTRTIIVGTQMPVLAASVCGLWSLARVSYTFGYLTGDPTKVSETAMLVIRILNID